MKAEGSIKQEHILDAAIKRFSHFGVNKTTLTEIAEDLDISKPALFYYFHDKNALIAAVAGKIINECLEAYQAALQSTTSVEEGLLKVVEVKREFFKKYYLLAIQGDNVDVNKISNSITALYAQGRKNTVSLISDHLAKGVEQHLLRPIDTEKTSQLLFDTLSAFESCIKARKAVPQIKDIDEMFDKQKEVLQMLLNGLKSNEWKN